jgi:hypothetical protein
LAASSGPAGPSTAAPGPAGAGGERVRQLVRAVHASVCGGAGPAAVRASWVLGEAAVRTRSALGRLGPGYLGQPVVPPGSLSEKQARALLDADARARAYVRGRAPEPVRQCAGVRSIAMTSGAWCRCVMCALVRSFACVRSCARARLREYALCACVCACVRARALVLSSGAPDPLGGELVQRERAGEGARGCVGPGDVCWAGGRGGQVLVLSDVSQELRAEYSLRKQMLLQVCVLGRHGRMLYGYR